MGRWVDDAGESRESKSSLCLKFSAMEMELCVFDIYFLMDKWV